MQITNQFKKAAGCLIFMLISLLFSQNVCSYELSYTIQTGSFVSENDAGKQFDLVMEAFHGEELYYLRIEKIGKYYSLRLGKFDDRASAEKLFAKVKKKFSSAIVMNAYIKDERVMKSYRTPVHVDTNKTGEKTAPHSAFPSGLIYTVQTGSFSSEKAAYKQFDYIIRKLQGSALDFLRIEKIGRYYCLRLGNFEKRESIVSMYNAVMAILPKAVIMDAYMKEQRIVKLYRNVSLQEAKKRLDTNRDIQENGNASVTERIEKQGRIISEISGTPENKDDHEAGRAAAKLSMKEDTVPDLFFKDKKPLLNENLQRKIRPNNERKGDMYVEKKQYFRALEEYRLARYKRPVLRRKMAVLLYRMGFVDESISEMETVVELSPAISADRMMLGTLYLATGDESKAKEQFIEALRINPGYTYAYYYLAEIFIEEKQYDMAWMSAKLALRLGYKGEALANRLRSISSEPSANPWSVTEDGLSLRLILVNTYKQASEILDRIKNGELFELIAANESLGPGRNAGGFMGQLSPFEVVPEIYAAMNNQDAFSVPVIVKTRNGYHVVQKIMCFDINKWKNILADSGEMDLLTANNLK